MQSTTTKKNHLMRVIFVALTWFAATAWAMAQTSPSVTGVVTDSSGEPLIGATVKEKGTKNVTATDIDGNFTLKVSGAKPAIEASYIGYNPKTIQAAPGQKLTFVLATAETDLEEVVVVAYGVQKKATVTGSIATVDSKELAKSSQPNVAAALAGKLPGLTTIQTNGAPGKDEVEMYLRGAATTNSTNPLILVDGIPRETIREIDANEIATISVLKDASATAVFGVRGANGVILITTKRGEQGKVNVNSSVRYSLQSFARKPFHRNSWEYAEMLNEARANEDMGPEFSQEDIAKYQMWRDGNGPTDPMERYWFPNTDWASIYFKDHSSMVQANVNVTGGTDKLQYFVNAAYVYQGGMYNTEDSRTLGYDPQAKLNRYNLRANLDYKFSDMVKMSIDMSSFIEKVNGTNGVESAVWGDAITARTTTPGPLTPEGQLVREDGTNPDGSVKTHPVRPGQVVADPAQTLQNGYGNMNRCGYRLDTRSGLNAIATLNIDLARLTPGLSLRGIASFESRGTSTNSGLKGFVSYKFDRNPGGLNHPIFTFDGDNEEDDRLSLYRSVSSRWFLNAQAQANYNRTFNSLHAVTGMVMFQRDIRENDGGDIPFNMIGLSARATYAYDSRYLAEVNVGYNGTEQFAPGHRFGFFPAFSAGWVVTNEKFMEGLRYSNFLTKLKLRASVGKVGNDGLGGTRFLYLDKITHAYHGGEYGIPSLGNSGRIEVSMLGNRDIHWETAWKQNYAVDVTMFNNLDFTFDYYIEDRRDILIARNTVPLISGLNKNQLPRLNMGRIKNSGYETTANYRIPLKKDAYIAIGGNFSYNNNEVLEADEATLGADYAYRTRMTGHRLGQLWGYEIDYSVDPATGRDGSGFFNSKEQIKQIGLKYEGTPRPGDFIYRDLNGDGKINDRDLAPIGYSSMLPKIGYGVSLSGGWNNFDASIMFQGTGKYSKYYSGHGIYEESGTHYFPDMVNNRWSTERYAQGLPIDAPRLANSQSTSHVPNSYYIMDASYTRLKSAELGYTIPARAAKKAGFQNVRVYASGENLFTWQHLRTNSFDPEQRNILDYPLMRTYSFGLNISF